MVKITYVDQSGTGRVVEVEPGLSVMEGAVRNGIPGIDADCGGAMACATCHVYVDPKWVALIAPAREEEHDMLDFAQDVRKNSRLSCQIVASEELDGLVVRTPASQR